MKHDHLDKIKKRKRFGRIVYFLLGILLTTTGVLSVLSGKFVYHNYRGLIVFGPYVIIGGLLLLFVVIFRWKQFSEIELYRTSRDKESLKPHGRYKFTSPWHIIEDSQLQSFVAELKRELSPEHPLFGQPIAAVTHRCDCDDVLFRFGHSLDRYAVVHLTFAGKEILPQWPKTQIFESLDQFFNERMKQDSLDYETSPKKTVNFTSPSAG
jgi:hypothetical protein